MLFANALHSSYGAESLEDKPSRTIKPTGRLIMRITSALFNDGGLSGDSVIVVQSNDDPEVGLIYVLGFTPKDLPSTILPLLGQDIDGATAMMISRPISTARISTLKKELPARYRNAYAYGAADDKVPCTAFVVGPSSKLAQPERFFTNANRPRY